MNNQNVRLQSVYSDGVMIINVGDTIVKLKEHPQVWLPHDPTLQFLATLENKSIKNTFKGAEILDIGTGTGVLGIWALRAGAKKASLVDVNKNALKVAEENMFLNGIDTNLNNFQIIESDVFANITDTFDIIVANPPVQPEIAQAHICEPACKFNENPSNGRYVLDEIIKKSKDYLNPGGKLFLLNSTRQGFSTTTKLLNKHWDESNWSSIFEKEYDIDYDYHGPYMDFWLKLQNMDDDLRVYHYDTKSGRKRSNPFYDRDLIWKHQSIIIAANNA